MIKCQSCNHENDPGSTFCTNCGQSIQSSIACSSCGSANDVGAAFCIDCGKPQNSSQTTGIVGTEQPIEFLSELDEETIIFLEKSNAQVPFGCVAVFIADGVISDFKHSGSLSASSGGGFLNFLKEVGSLAKKLLGVSSSNKENKRILLLQDIKGLPLVKHQVPLKISGSPNAALSFEFYFDFEDTNAKEKLGIFLQRHLGSKNKILFQDLKNAAIANLPNLLESYDHQQLSSETTRQQLTAQITQLSGISAKCTFQYGNNLNRQQIEISKFNDPVACPNCSISITTSSKFCEECGHDVSGIDFNKGSKFLLSSDGEQLTLKIVYFEDEFDSGMFSQGELSQKLFDLSQNILSQYSVNDLASAKILSNISADLSGQLTQAMQNYIHDVSILDIKTAQQDWLFNTEALIKEELRNVDANKKRLVIEGAELDLQQAAMAMAMRRVELESDHDLELRRQALNARKQSAELELDEHALESEVNLKKRDIDKATISAEREDQFSQLDHEKKLEREAALHDVDLANISDEARSQSNRRGVDDSSYAEQEKIRLEAERKSKLGNVEEDLKDRDSQRQLDKMQKMAEMEAAMAKQDMDFELQKTEAMKNMTPQEILAMQAAQLAKTAGKDGAADVVKSIAESQAESSGAKIKDDLYKQMLETQKDALNTALESQKAANETLLKSNQQFEKMSEKSMESMSKVATAKASNKSDTKAANDNSIDCPNEDCDASFKGKVPKFCNKCGTSMDIS